MDNIISDEIIEYTGALAKLMLSAEEKHRVKLEMAKMLDYFDMLNDLDTNGAEPVSHIIPITNVFREDVVENADGSEDALANAPERKDNYFSVPKVIN